jgi:hypothetical protein
MLGFAFGSAPTYKTNWPNLRGLRFACPGYLADPSHCRRAARTRDAGRRELSTSDPRWAGCVISFLIQYASHRQAVSLDNVCELGHTSSPRLFVCGLRLGYRSALKFVLFFNDLRYAQSAGKPAPQRAGKSHLKLMREMCCGTSVVRSMGRFMSNLLLKFTSLKCLKLPLAMVANLAIIIGIIVAIVQYLKAVEIDRRQTSIAILKPTREVPVIQSLRRLIVALHEHSQSELTPKLIEDADLVLNVYDSVAIYYFFGAVNKCLVKEHVHAILPDVVEVIRARGYPDSSLRRVSALKADLDKLSCNNMIY